MSKSTLDRSCATNKASAFDSQIQTFEHLVASCWTSLWHSHLVSCRHLVATLVHPAHLVASRASRASLFDCRIALLVKLVCSNWKREWTLWWSFCQRAQKTEVIVIEMVIRNCECMWAKNLNCVDSNLPLVDTVTGICNWTVQKRILLLRSDSV